MRPAGERIVLWDGSTENSTVCQSLLANLQSRGLRTDRSVLVSLAQDLSAVWHAPATDMRLTDYAA